MFHWIKRMFTRTVGTKDIDGTYTDYTNILNTSFNNKGEIIADLIQHIVSNDFSISPSNLIVFYKEKYDLSLNEFLMLLFKVGMIARSYIDDPITLLNAAMTLDNIYSPAVLDEFQSLILNYEREDEIRLRESYDEYIRKTAAMQQESPVDDADKQIDDWLAKNKKEEDDKDS